MAFRVLWLSQVICLLHTVTAHCPVQPCTRHVFKCPSQSQKNNAQMATRAFFKKSQSQQFLVYLIRSFLFPLACAEVSDIHLGWEDAPALEETGEFQAGAAKRYTPQRGDCPRAEGRGERTEGGRDGGLNRPSGGFCFTCMWSSGQSSAQNQRSSCDGCTNTERH